MLAIVAAVGGTALADSEPTATSAKSAKKIAKSAKKKAKKANKNAKAAQGAADSAQGTANSPGYGRHGARTFRVDVL